MPGASNDPVLDYLIDQASRSRNASQAAAIGGASGVGASLGASPGTGGASLLGLLPSIAALLYGVGEKGREMRMTGGADAFRRTGMPGSPHDPGRGVGGVGYNDY